MKKFLLNQILKMDLVIFFCFFSLVSIGVIMIFSTSNVVGLQHYQDSFFFIKRHLAYLFIGIIGMLIAFFFPVEHYKKIVFPALVVGIILMILTLIPGIGVKVAGARRWINLGVIQFQTIELLKFIIVVYTAIFFNYKSKQKSNFLLGFLPLLSVYALILILLFFQPDLGNIILLSIILMIMLFIANMNWSWLISLASSGLMLIGISLYSNPYQLKRVTSLFKSRKRSVGSGENI